MPKCGAFPSFLCSARLASLVTVLHAGLIATWMAGPITNWTVKTKENTLIAQGYV